MSRKLENAKKLHRVAQRAYLARQQAQHVPSATILYRAIARAIRNEAVARFVNIGEQSGQAVLVAILRFAFEDLLADGYSEAGIKSRLEQFYKPRRKPGIARGSVDPDDRDVVADVMEALGLRAS